VQVSALIYLLGTTQLAPFILGADGSKNQNVVDKQFGDKV